MTSISAAVLDCTYGRAADAIQVRVDRASGADWVSVAQAETSSDGRVEDWDCGSIGQGLYRIVLDSGSYFAGLGLRAAFPEIHVSFTVGKECGRCHIQVAISPYSFSVHFEDVAVY